MNTLTIVVPCFNEQDVFPETRRRLAALLQSLREQGLVAPTSHVLFVDDGSRDATWRLIEQAHRQSDDFDGLKLARNVGHQRALHAGLMHASGDLVISVDADLQDDLSVMADMIRMAAQGAQIVYGVRRNRDTDTLFKRATAQGYYRLLAAFQVDVVYNHADYRLMTRKAIEALRQYREVNLFLRGMVTQLGFATDKVYYDRAERFAGESKYPLSKMLALAWQGVTSFSALPLRMITFAGIVFALASLSLSFWALYVKLFTASAVPGWASLVVPTFFLGGIQLLCLGVVGEYVAKLYLESKRRPHYHVDRLTYREQESTREPARQAKAPRPHWVLERSAAPDRSEPAAQIE